MPPRKDEGDVFGKGIAGHIRRAAESLQLPPEIVSRLNSPEREVNVGFVVQMDDGSTRELRGQRVVHSTVLGPGKGGIRMVPGLTREAVRALAAEMPIKSGIHGLPLGGAKGGIDIDTSTLSDQELSLVMRGYVRAVLDEGRDSHGKVAFGLDTDVAAPDVGSSPPSVNLMDISADETIRWLVDNKIKRASGVDVPLKSLSTIPTTLGADQTPMVDAYQAMHRVGEIENLALLGSFTGKSVSKGGSEGRTQATGLGVAFASMEYMKIQGTLPPDATRFTTQSVAVQGFGNVGQGAVQSFTELNANVKAIAEFDGEEYVLFFEKGIKPKTVEDLERYKLEHGSLRGFPGAKSIDMDAFWSLDVDVMVPSARENVITPDVARNIRASIVTEGANGPTVPDADKILASRGIAVIPDVFANAAGVMVSFFEMEQDRLGETWSEAKVRKKMHDLIKTQIRRIVKASAGSTLRDGAFKIGLASIAAGHSPTPNSRPSGSSSRSDRAS